MAGASADLDPLAGLDLGLLGLLSCTGLGCRGRKAKDEGRILGTPRGVSDSGPNSATPPPPRRGAHSVGFATGRNSLPSPVRSTRSPQRALAKSASSGSLEGAKQALLDSRAELDGHKKKREFLELQRQVPSCAG